MSPSSLIISPTSLSQPTLTSSYILEPDMFSATTTIKICKKARLDTYARKVPTVRYMEASNWKGIGAWVSTYAGQRLWRCVHTWTLPFRSCLPCCFLSCISQRVRVLGVYLLLCLSVINKSLTVSVEAINVCVLWTEKINRPRLLSDLIFYL